jgi:hypothetical protein
MNQEDIRVSEIQAATHIAQGRESSKVAEAYMTAIHTRNIESLGNTLHADLHVVGPAGDVHNRASFLETMRNMVVHLVRTFICLTWSWLLPRPPCEPPI